MTEQKVPGSFLATIDPQYDSIATSFYIQALTALEFAEKRVILTTEDMKPASDDLNLIRKLKKAMESRRKDYLEPFQAHIKEVNEAYKVLMAPVEAADKITGDKMLAFNNEQSRIRREQERINEERMKLAQDEMKLTGELTESVNLVEVLPPVVTTTRTDLGSTGMRNNWTWEVADINAVPREYLMINAGMLTPIVKASKGQIIIPGVRIYNKPILAVGK